MLRIEAHRFATGRFYATAIKLSRLRVVSATRRKQQTYCSRNFRKNCLGDYKVSLIFGFVLLCSLYFSSVGGKQSRANLFYWESNSRILPPRQSNFWENCTCAVRLQFFVCIMFVASKDSVKVEQKWFKSCFNRRRFIV